MANYYFLAASLPPLAIGQKSDLSFQELKNRLAINLDKTDFTKTVVLREMIDLNNIRALFLKEPIDPRGNLSEKELDEALLVRALLPSFVFDFLDRYETIEEKLNHFSGLLATFFIEETPLQKGFLKNYLIFEKEYRLVLVALRAKQQGRDVTRELQFEDFSDPLVAHILAQKDASSYEPPVDFHELKEIMLSSSMDPWLMNKRFVEWKFRRIAELVDSPPFTIDWILAYMAQLMLVEQWNELDGEKGIRIIKNRLMNE